MNERKKKNGITKLTRNRWGRWKWKLLSPFKASWNRIYNLIFKVVARMILLCLFDQFKATCRCFGVYKLEIFVALDVCQKYFQIMCSATDNHPQCQIHLIRVSINIFIFHMIFSIYILFNAKYRYALLFIYLFFHIKNMNGKRKEIELLPEDKQIVMKKKERCYRAPNGEIICE